MTVRRRWKMMLPTATLGISAFTAFSPSAQAFFPPISPPPPPITVIASPPTPPPITVVPPVSPPPFTVVPPTSPPPITVPPSCCQSHCVPEPSSLVAGIAGLTTAAGWAARRRKIRA